MPNGRDDLALPYVVEPDIHESRAAAYAIIRRLSPPDLALATMMLEAAFFYARPHDAVEAPPCPIVVCASR